ncbi:uncharacterized protein C8R40DRAFT_1079172 [Lentinula edodes]|uniref:uncharacterized protein n=1 Tax=Lentinula edodes TaxID=5353 RepID=UPI001E8E66F7|nr:uncharacterized protein C8R40DRAFT_1079172 [Lentinula edodes]KAH7881638.1 hypothetical protein C8R40DRAFT_1079172 [Lentinula edodes]
MNLEPATCGTMDNFMELLMTCNETVSREDVRTCPSSPDVTMKYLTHQKHLHRLYVV